MGNVLKDKQEGSAHAAQAFQAWLNLKGYSYIYLEQSTLTFPEKFLGAIKRPDFLIGTFRHGAFFVDVKGHGFYQDDDGSYFSLLADEALQYHRLEAFVGLPVWLAYLPEEEGLQAAYFYPTSLVANNLPALDYNGREFFKIHLNAASLKRVPLNSSGQLSCLC
ncbi:hypothetical protein MTBLM1_10277 [Rhodospirillaceae bacterium LM-1]|nr:hypothetical protein MTBLM1_10277 [Rhodospirillaceae bacterium LM-1]